MPLRGYYLFTCYIEIIFITNFCSTGWLSENSTCGVQINWLEGRMGIVALLEEQRSTPTLGNFQAT
jgi:hypothetical protein